MKKILLIALCLLIPSLAWGSYPTNLDSFSAKGAGDTIAEGDVNEMHTPIVQLETKLGTGADTPTNGDILKGTGVGTSGWAVLSTSDIPTGSAGTLTAGTSCVQNPFTGQTKTTQAHGLGAIPTMVVAYYECLSVDNGYAVGDRISLVTDIIGGNAGSVIRWDATNVYVLSDTNPPVAVNGTTPTTAVNLTASKWKVVAVPYKLN